MTQNDEDRLAPVRTAAAGLPSAQQLISALQPVTQLSSAACALIAKIIEEARGKNGAASASAPAEAPRVDVKASSSLVPQLSFINPRGKHDLVFFEEQIVIKTAKTDVIVPLTAIKTIIILDSIPKDTKGRVLLYVHLDASARIMNGKAKLTSLVMQVTAEQQLDIPHPRAPGQRLQGVAAVVLCQVFGALGVSGSIFSAPDADYFTSSEGGSGIQAFVKAREGLLFPLPAGLCFLESPATFIPRESIRSVELARANGTSSTFDLYVHCMDGNLVEFSNISRLEVSAFEGYVRTAKLIVGPTASSGEEDESGEKSDAGEDSDDDPEDEDFNPVESSDDDTQRPRKRRRGGNSPVEASDRGMTDIEQEAIENEEEEFEDSDDDESDDSGEVELVSEEEFSMGRLQDLMEEERNRIPKA